MGRFEVAFDLTLGGRRLRLRLPMIPIEEVIRFKPPRIPDERLRFEGAPWLLDETGAETEIEVLDVLHITANDGHPALASLTTS